MRRAEWRSIAGDPKTLFGWWWRKGCKDGYVVVLPAMVLASTAMVVARSPLIPAVLTLFTIIAGGVRSMLNRDELKPILADPPPGEQFRAVAAYRREGFEIGRDDVALTFVDGWLIAEGLRSYFAISRNELIGLQTDRNLRASLHLSDRSTVDLHGVNDEARAALDRWFSGTEVAVGHSTFPPAQVFPPNAGEVAGVGLLRDHGLAGDHRADPNLRGRIGAICGFTDRLCRRLVPSHAASRRPGTAEKSGRRG